MPATACIAEKWSSSPRGVNHIGTENAKMPFKSKAQQRYLESERPEVAKQFVKHTATKKKTKKQSLKKIFG